MRTIRQQLNDPIFRITSLRKAFVECYSVLGFGIMLGFIVGHYWR